MRDANREWSSARDEHYSVFTQQLPDVKLHVPAIGNEVYAPLGSDAGTGARVPTFYVATSSSAHRLWLHVHGGVGHGQGLHAAEI